MGTLSNLLSIADKQVGIVESPPNSNKVLYNTWFYGKAVSGDGYPWCMTFCQWVYKQAGIKLPSTTTASCTAMMDAAKKAGCFVSRTNLKPGDLLLFNFEGKTTVSTHCGILQSISGTKLRSIEGNTSVGNDTNGGAVMIRDRITSQVVGAVRPIFKEELDMTKSEFLKSLTDAEAYSLLEKAMKHLDSQKEPDWSKKEGHWARATKDKVVDGSRPESYMRRDEAIAILGRKGLV